MNTERDYIEEKLITAGFSEQHIEEQEKLIQTTIDATKRALSIANVSGSVDSMKEAMESFEQELKKANK